MQTQPRIPRQASLIIRLIVGDLPIAVPKGDIADEDIF